MNISALLRRFFPEEPDFEHAEFREFEDSLQNFMIFYPKHWKFERTTAVIDGAYNILFDSSMSDTHICISVEMRLPPAFNKSKFLRAAKGEIEKPSAGVLAKAREGKFKEYPSMATDYTFSKGQAKMRGEKTIFYTGDRVFSILFICPISQYDKLKKTIEYVKDSFVVKPKKMVLA